MSELMYITALGEDSHRFLPESSDKPLVLAGLVIDGYPGLEGNSDADVILHALTNAISGLTTKPILGERADRLCLAGDTNSLTYLRLALADLVADPRGFRLLHLSVVLEGARPRFSNLSDDIRANLAQILQLEKQQVALTATSGEDLTSFGRGEGLRCSCLLSTSCHY
ncbi:MAG: 2-C-methyl-D-erythritol 2,4-cyclodiphosphate synthase [Eubacteriales bacterium]|nr:2-C-methyl-D-erythritol 2,4-cyclodiphosphate synthase [Eubacteriales bacterium]